jgi:hypothetical protein
LFFDRDALSMTLGSGAAAASHHFQRSQTCEADQIQNMSVWHFKELLFDHLTLK